MENPQHVLLLWRGFEEVTAAELFAVANITKSTSFERLDPTSWQELAREVLKRQPILVLLPPEPDSEPDSATGQTYEQQVKLVLDSEIARTGTAVHGYGYDKENKSSVKGPEFGKLKVMHYRKPDGTNRLEFDHGKWFKSHNF